MNRKYILLTNDYHKIGTFNNLEEAFKEADWHDGDHIVETVIDENNTEYELD